MKMVELLAEKFCHAFYHHRWPGGPLRSLRWLVTSLFAKGLSLSKGSVVIPGSPVELVSIDRNTEVKVVIESLGSLVGVFRRGDELMK